MPASDRVLPFVARASHAPTDITDRVYQSTLMRALSRYWRSELSDREYAMLAYIMDHTVEWGRLAYLFTYKSLAEGTQASPCGLSKSEQQLRQTLVSLERKGAVSVMRGRDGLAITFNPQWRPIRSARKRSTNAETPLEIQGVDHRISKGQTLGNPHPLLEEHLEQQDRRAIRPADADRSAVSFFEGCSTSETKVVPTPVRKRTRPTRPENFDPHQESASVLPIPEVRTRTRPVRFRPEAAKDQPDAHRSQRHGDALFTTWRAAYKRSYAGIGGAGCVDWSKAEMAMVVTQLAKPFKGTSPELHDFIDWIVSNWGVVMVERFGWMKRKKPPELPNLRFVLGFKHEFFAEYGRRSVDRYLASLSDHERAIRRGKLRDGLTEQQVDIQLAERRARQQLRKEIERGKTELEQQRRTINAARARLEAERRELARMATRTKPQSAPPLLPGGAREVSDEELAESVQLVAKMIEVDPDGE